MPIDERLRTGLAANTDHLLVDVEAELTTTYARVRERRWRRTGLVLATAAAVGVIVWLGTLPDRDDEAAPATPDPGPSSAVDLVGVRGPLEPGTYSMAVWGESTQTGPLPRVVLEVPEGYFSNGGYVIDAGGGVEFDQRGEVMVWHVDRVPTDPCRPRTSAEVGPSVEDLARALAAQGGRTVSPRPTSIAGHRGLRLDVTVPADVLTRCSRGYSLWQDLEQDTPGVIDHVSILDVDGTRLVVLVTEFPDQPAGQFPELTGIAESIRFETE